MIRINKILMFVALLLMTVSCKKIVIGNGGEDAWYSNLKLVFDWNVYKDTPKTDMCLLAARIVDTKHDYFMTDSNAKFIAERPYDLLPDVLDNSLLLNGDSTLLKIAAGEYAMFVVSSERGKSEVANMDGFINDPENVGLTSLVYTYREVEENEKPQIGDVAWIEHSGYETYVNDGPKFFGRLDDIEIPDDKSSVVAYFNIDMLTQKVNFDFDIDIRQTEGYSLKIRDLKVELSGIVKDVSLYEMSLSYATYGKMFMQGNLTESSVDNNVSYHYNGVINSLGILYDDDYSTVAGPGIMRAGFYMEIYDSDGNLYAKRILYAVKNICREIEAAGLTEFENTTILKQKVKTANIKIDRLIIDAEAVVSGSGGGAIGWDESNIDENI